MNTCRFCKKWEGQLIKYSVRHYAHPACYLDAGKRLNDLRPWQVGEFPYFVLEERGLLSQASAILENDHNSDHIIPSFRGQPSKT